MDWLKDKKNQPIIIAVAIVIILGVAFCGWWFFVRQPSQPSESTGTQAQTPPPDSAPTGAQSAAPANPEQPAAGTPPGAAPPPGATAPTASAPAGQPGAPTGTPAQAGAAQPSQVASVKPMETWRADPFLPIGYKPPKQVRVVPPIRDFPFEKLFQHQRKPTKAHQTAEIQQPSRRMAGILLGDRVYAIIETNGVTQVVQPGDYTTDRLAIVQKIEPDKVVLKTVDEKPRYVTVRMAASPTVQSPSAPSTPVNPVLPGPRGAAPPLPPGAGYPPGGPPGEMP